MLAFASFVLGSYCDGSVVNFDDLSEQIAVTIDGTPISNGGRVSNLVFNGESVNFDLLVNGTTNVVTETLFTQRIRSTRTTTPAPSATSSLNPL
jgi:hypothetical protein